MTLNIENARAVQPRPMTHRLADGSEITLAAGMWCGECGDDLRAVDAELLEPGVRLVCRCGHLIWHYDPRARS